VPDAVLALAEQLLRIPSVTGDERAIADFLEARLRALRPHALVRATNSLCIVPRAPRRGHATVMLVGHTDTVPDLSDNPVRRDGDRLYGLGATDMKAAVAVIVDAVDRAIRTAPKHDLVAVLYAREEGSFVDSEMPAIREAARAWFDATDLAVCMEPTDGALELGCLGTCHATVTFHGRRAHSARPWQGDNAIHKAAPFLARVAGWGVREHEYDGLVFREVMSATTAAFRGARNVVPDRFELNVNYRFAPGLSEDDVRRELASLVAGEAELELTDFCPAGRVCADNPLCGELRAAAGNPEIRAKQAWTDVGRLSGWGIDAVNWGPGATAQAHQAGEWVSAQAVAGARDALGAWLFAG
jgi:succinyl-diaminopimelate desuccinylase